LPDEAADPLQQILGGPVAIWMGAGKLQWSFGGATPQVVPLPAGDLPELEPLHWAIVAVRKDTNSPYTFTVFRNTIEIRSITSTEASSASNSENLTIGGAEGTGWTGKLAHLRMWSAALDAVELKKNMARDITAHAAFKASTGIDWRLLNAYDEPALYIKGSGGKQALCLEVENATKETTLVIPKADATARASYDNRHFQLVFRPGTIAAKVLDKCLDEFVTDKRNDGWSVGKKEWNRQDCLFFLWKGEEDKHLEPGKTLKIFLPGLHAESGSGSRTTQVLLTYKNLKLKSKEGMVSTGPLDGHRAQLLNIVYRDPLVPYRRPPLEVGVVGAPAILNNGTETCLTLYIKNLNRDNVGSSADLPLGPANGKADKLAKFILEIDLLTEAVETPGSELKQGDKYWSNGKAFEVLSRTDKSWRLKDLITNEEDTSQSVPEHVLVSGEGPIDAKGLGDFDDLMATDLTSSNPHIKPDKDPKVGGVARWEITPKQEIDDDKVGFKKNETVLLTLAGLKTAAPPGRSVLRLRYEDFEEYGEGVFEIPVDRVPAVPAKLTQGGAGFGLALGHDPRTGQADPNAEVLDELLSVKKQKGNGDAVRIENAGGGSGLTVVQKGSGPSATFSGGSGVEIDGKWLANAEAEITGTLIANSDVEMSGKLLAKTGADITGKLVANSDVEIGGKLVAKRGADIEGNLVAKNGAAITGKLVANTDVEIGGKLLAKRGADITGQLNLVGYVGYGASHSKLKVGNSPDDCIDLYFNQGSGCGRLEVVGYPGGWTINTKGTRNDKKAGQDFAINKFGPGNLPPGNVGIGRTPDTDKKLDVQGDICARGKVRLGNVPVWDGTDDNDLTWDGSRICREGSSRRYKKRISPLKDNFLNVLKMVPKKFQMKEDCGDPDAWNYGYIAEELDELGLKNLVTYDDRGRPDGVKYKKVAIYALEACKQRMAEQDGTIAALESQLRDMKRHQQKTDKRLTALEKKLSKL